MPHTEPIAAPSETSNVNGASTLHDLFALTDEQILEIEPEAQDVEVSERQPTITGEDASRVAPPSLPAGFAAANDNRLQETGAASAAPASNAARPLNSEATQPPNWLAEKMSDPQSGGEARELWNGLQQARQEAAAYREVFAKPEEARTAAQRARVLDDIDRAYFAGDTNQRAQLAAMMLREDPAAFREMVFEGLRTLEKANGAATAPSSASAAGAQRGTENAGETRPEQAAPVATQNARASSASSREADLAAYASFERAANEDLERSVGVAIERRLEQALPAAGTADGAALKGRLSAAIRQDIEKALQGDRQLGEQVAQILSGRRLDGETRAQVVRLIGERAAQLVPGAAKRALNDWTQTTLAAHGARRTRTDAASARREVATAPATQGLPREQAKNQRQDAQRQNARPANESSSRRVDYGKLSDEQILEL
jgi:hypothetical protein